MQLKPVTVIALLVVVVLASRNTSMGLQSRETSNIKLVVNSLPAEDGVPPIEIIQPAVVSSAPNRLDDLNYRLRNNSGKTVLAVGVIETISYEDGGKLYAQSVYSTIDTALHPDMAGKPFLSGSQMLMEAAGPSSFDGAVSIKEITLTIDYVSYADQTAYGSGGEGDRIINGMHEGARRYKSWLAEEYVRGGKSLVTIIPLIQTPQLPEELKLDQNQSVGANRYRIYLLNTFHKKGAADIENCLKQTK